MKSQLKLLYTKNRIYYEVWSWLWIMSDSKNTIIFSYVELSNRFNVPKSTLRRIISYCENWNKEKIYVRVSKDKTKFIVTFFPKGKVISNIKTLEEILIDELFDYLIEYYKKNDFEYLNINKHKPKVKKIINKINQAITNKGLVVNSQSTKETFQFFFENIPKWWKENSFELTSIDKNFNKILHSIKTNKKNDKFSDTYKDTKKIDYSKLTKKK